MKRIIYTDELGKRQASYVPNDAINPEQGIPVLIPDIYELDWDTIILDIHNSLVDNELFSWADVQRHQNGLTSVLRTTVLRYLVTLYRMEDKQNG